MKTLGPSHRSLYHDPTSASLMGAGIAMSRGYPAHWGQAAALLHLLEDKVISQVPQPWRAFVIQWLEEGKR